MGLALGGVGIAAGTGNTGNIFYCNNSTAAGGSADSNAAMAVGGSGVAAGTSGSNNVVAANNNAVGTCGLAIGATNASDTTVHASHNNNAMGMGGKACAAAKGNSPTICSATSIAMDGTALGTATSRNVIVRNGGGIALGGYALASGGAALGNRSAACGGVFLCRSVDKSTTSNDTDFGTANSGVAAGGKSAFCVAGASTGVDLAGGAVAGASDAKGFLQTRTSS